MKLLYITSLSGRRINGFMRSAIVAANRLGIDFTMACNMDMADKAGYAQDCKAYGIKTVHIDFERNPLKPKNKTAYNQLRKLMEDGQFDIVHCNTPIGGLLGRLCAHKAKVPYVIYQSHGFHFWKGAPLKNWLCYYTVEWLLARYTDMLITINREDYAFANRFALKKNGHTAYVHGVGVDTERFVNVKKDPAIRASLDTPEDALVYVTTGEVNDNKNQGVIIRALAKLNETDQYLWICGEGAKLEELKQLAKDLGVADRIRFIGYRSDIERVLAAADVFVFATKREGLGISLAEAMVIGIPCIASDVRGPRDLLQDSKYLFDPENVDELCEKMRQLAADDQVAIVEANKKNVAPYLFEPAVKELMELYRSVL